MFKINIMRKGEWEMKKKMNNKGFSLVELIIVIAIMVILVAVLAPQYLKYVEKSRVATDTQTTVEFINAMQVVAADPDITLDGSTAGKYKVTASGATITVTDELIKVFVDNGIMEAGSFASGSGDRASTSKYQSTAYTNPSTAITMTLEYNSTTTTWSVKCTGVDNSGAIVKPASP